MRDYRGILFFWFINLIIYRSFDLDFSWNYLKLLASLWVSMAIKLKVSILFHKFELDIEFIGV